MKAAVPKTARRRIQFSDEEGKDEGEKDEALNEEKK